MAQQLKPKQEEKSQSWWERAIEQQGEVEILNGQAQLEGGRVEREAAWDATQGANEAIKVNMSMGLY